MGQVLAEVGQMEGWGEVLISRRLLPQMGLWWMLLKLPGQLRWPLGWSVAAVG